MNYTIRILQATPMARELWIVSFEPHISIEQCEKVGQVLAKLTAKRNADFFIGTGIAVQVSGKLSLLARFMAWWNSKP